MTPAQIAKMHIAEDFATRHGVDVRLLLHAAAQQGHDAGVRALLDAGADVNYQDEEGSTALFIAAENGHARSCARCSTPALTRPSRGSTASPLC